MQHNSRLKHLELGRCGFTAEGTNSIVDALKVNSTLEHLNISRNSIGDSDNTNMGLAVTHSSGPALTEMLKVNHTLQTLDMSYNSGVTEVCGTFFFFIAEGLKHNSGLKHLELRGCGITADGANSIADALKVNRTLEHLNISCNSIGDTGFAHIAEALKSNHTLKKLELADCRQTEKGLTVLSASLVLNKCLQYLDIATKSHYFWLQKAQTKRVDYKEFVSSLHENLHLTMLRLGPANRKDIVEGEKSALNQVQRDKCLQELEIDLV